MKMRLCLVICLILAFVLLAQAAERPAYDAKVEVFFSPHGGCTEAIVREISGAQKSIRVQAYSFTSADIAKALVEAFTRNGMEPAFTVSAS